MKSVQPRSSFVARLPIPDENFIEEKLGTLCDIEKLHSQFSGRVSVYPVWKGIYVIGLVALEALAVYVYQQARPYTAWGIGIVSFLGFVWKYNNIGGCWSAVQKSTPIFQQAREQLQQARQVKSDVLISCFRSLGETWINKASAEATIKALSQAYDKVDQDLSCAYKLTDEQNAWRQVHAKMVDKVQTITTLDPEKFYKNPTYHGFFTTRLGKHIFNLQKEALRLIHGKHPREENDPYVQIKERLLPEKESQFTAESWDR